MFSTKARYLDLLAWIANGCRCLNNNSAPCRLCRAQEIYPAKFDELEELGLIWRCSTHPSVTESAGWRPTTESADWRPSKRLSIGLTFDGRDAHCGKGPLVLFLQAEPVVTYEVR
jgi:hypothetical protein